MEYSKIDNAQYSSGCLLKKHPHQDKIIRLESLDSTTINNIDKRVHISVKQNIIERNACVNYHDKKYI